MNDVERKALAEGLMRDWLAFNDPDAELRRCNLEHFFADRVVPKLATPLMLRALELWKERAILDEPRTFAELDRISLRRCIESGLALGREALALEKPRPNREWVPKTHADGRSWFIHLEGDLDCICLAGKNLTEKQARAVAATLNSMDAEADAGRRNAG